MSQIQQVKDAIDIIELIGERVDLKRSGKNWRGLCPFHGEKTPSFFVSDELQRYKCFGCGESGDVFTFLEKFDGMSFSEALHQLAERAGITLQDYRPTAADQQRTLLLEILDLAKEYYHYLLTTHEVGQAARAYLKQRGLTQESITLFQLGYATSSWEGLIQYLHQKKKYPVEELIKTGLVIKNAQGRAYDRFRDRIIFPLKNHRGQVVGFSGRVLDPQAKEAKYINTPETSLYHKSELLYGYSELLSFIRQANEVIVAEGEFDVISSAQAHVNNIVAIKGSAFTAQHARYLKRVAERVVFALDMDTAGVAATRRAIPIAQAAGLELRVIRLDELHTDNEADDQPKDPDELARHQPKAWRAAAKHSLSVYEYLIRAALTEHDPRTPEGKRRIVTELAPVLAGITHAVERDYYLKSLAERLDVKVEVLEKDLEKFGQKSGSRSRPRPSTTESSPRGPSRREKLENYLWFLLLKSSAEQLVERLTKLDELQFVQPPLVNLTQQLKQFKPPFSLEAFAKTLPDDLQAMVFDLAVAPEYLSAVKKIDHDREWRQTWQELRRLKSQAEITAITAELDSLDNKTDKTVAEEQRQRELLERVVLLRSQTNGTTA